MLFETEESGGPSNHGVMVMKKMSVLTEEKEQERFKRYERKYLFAPSSVELPDIEQFPTIWKSSKVVSVSSSSNFLSSFILGKFFAVTTYILYFFALLLLQSDRRRYFCGLL